MQLQSRRGFIGTISAALTMMGLAPRAVIASETLGLADFSAWTKTKFYFASADGTAGGTVKLIKVQENSTDSTLSQFTLTFRAVRGASMPEGYYNVTNWSGHPNFDVHAIPAGVDKRGRELFLASFAHLQ